MNERIKELAEQSGLDIYGLGLDRNKWDTAVSKFAELIIKEVYKVADDNFYGDPHYVDEYIKDIEKHFGVK